MDIWVKATLNWGALCVSMGCERVSLPGALANVYPIEKSGTFYNIVHVQDPNSFSIPSAEGTFAARKLPFGIVLPRRSGYEQLEELLRARGYSLVKVWNLMWHEKGLGEINPKVAVEEIPGSRLSEWLAISNLSARREMIEASLTDGSTRLLLATLEGKAVGEGLIYLNDRVASIHLMETVPDFRRRHVATTLVTKMLERLMNEQLDLIWLRTRKGGVGEKVYSRIGFRSFTEILTYTRTPAFEDEGWISR